MNPHWKRWTLTAVVGAACWAMMPAADAGAQTLTEDQLKVFTYRSIGPTRQSGRFVDIAVPSQEPYTIYAATGSGSLWKTVNAGTTWESIFDYEAVFSIGDVTVAPSDPDIVWVGTGEANTSRSMYWGDGVYKSTDAGETWTNMGLPESHHVGRILIHPTNPNVVYVAAMGHLYSENPERGLYKTTNGGRTWDKALEVVDHGKHIGIIDAVMDPTNSDVIYAAAYDKVRKPYTFNLGGPGGGIYKTTDGGDSWTKLGGGLPGGMLGRIGIDVYLRNPNIVYANIENANKEGMSDEDRYQELLSDQSSRGMIDGEVYRFAAKILEGAGKMARAEAALRTRTEIAPSDSKRIDGVFALRRVPKRALSGTTAVVVVKPRVSCERSVVVAGTLARGVKPIKASARATFSRTCADGT